MRRILIITFLFSFVSVESYSQFGQNKVMYDRFDFEVFNTPHFEIHNYLKNDTVLFNLGQQSERWYLRHFAMFGDSLENSPIILYNNTTDFKQTTVISGIIGVGTGGVTEGLRSRVVIPVMVSNKETDHVLGHEMVHVFQYNLVRENDSLSFQSLMNTPLWMIEGMAEFLSIGSSDNRTSMWMRDAVINDDIPTIKDMTRKPGEYFPYRYGHAFWSYVTGVWGDNILQPLFYLSLRGGYDYAFKKLLKVDSDSLSVLWKNSILNEYKEYLTDTISPVGKVMFNAKSGGEINLSPVLSPDGKYITFLSNKDVINVDLLLADTKTNKVISKLTSSLRKSHIDDFNYIEDAGSWSPDGNQYIMTTFTKGTNKFLIATFQSNKVQSTREIEVEGIDALINPEWSPDGKTILFNGLVRGKSDLYLYDLESGEVEQLTNDLYSDLQPSWSADGSEIAFISDRGPDSDIKKQVYGTYRLCVLKKATKQIIVYDLFLGANIFSPQYSPSDSSLYFLSNADGFRNLYRYHLNTGEVFKLTKFATGISGITDLAPAYSVSRETGDVAYTIYRNDKYEIYKASPKDFLQIPVNPNEINLDAESLAPGKNRIINIVDHNLDFVKTFPEDSFRVQEYDPRFELEYIGSNGFGVAQSTYGTFASGGVSMLFSDMLKHHQIYTMLNINGEVYDFGGQLAYINSAHRFTWGSSFSHFPYRAMYYSLRLDTLTDGSSLLIENYDLVRIFEENLSFFSQYPLSTKLRFEGGLSYSRYSYRIDSITNYYTAYGNYQEKKKVDKVPDPFNVGNVYFAFVGDDSNFGITSPMMGYRYRFQIGQMFDRYEITNISFDIRKYFFFKPISLAFRAMHYGRYGKNANSLYPLYLGNEYLIRGYNFNAFYKSDDSNTSNKLDVNNIAGSKVIVFNSELRFPFTGVKRFSLIKSGFLYSDIILFFDAGVAWTKDRFPWLESSNIRYYWNPNPNYYTPIYSLGASLRINLFGIAILEPYIAIPFQLQNVNYATGFIISGGGW
ncbi:MAG TPA: tolB protein precursor [Bacteroidales bacterium]|nr:tolB protein precursor [Bacteroidales bacterium]